ncbi:hypothetical protein, partial [Ramlibacter sp.]|uniref:hypothetical protein n=1 Tax=Ramlibacter sp. TaxID=1917967 RepID=UPI00262C8F1D
FSTDPTELVDFYAVHQDPVSGSESDFFLGTFDPCCVPLGRFRSPVNNLGVFGDPTRDYRAVSRTMCQPPGLHAANTPQLQTRCMMAPPATPDPTVVQATVTQNVNGLTVGKYRLPNFEYIFGENLAFGGPIIPANLQDLPFLFCGSGPLDGPRTISPVVGQLDPAPWALPMADPAFHSTLCPQATAVGGAPGAPLPPVQPVPPVLNALVADGSVIADGLPHTVVLTVNATNPNTPATLMSYAWKTSAAGVQFSCGTCVANPGVSPVSITATITTKSVTPIAITTTVSNGVLPASSGTITIIPAVAGSLPPIVTTQGATQAGPTVTLSATAKAANGTSPITISFRQVGGPSVGLALLPTTGAPPNQSATATLTVPVSAAASTLKFVTIVTDPATGLQTTGATFSVTSPAILSDVLTITNVTYRPIVSRVGAPADLGKLTIVVSSNETDVNPLPDGMTMNAIVVNSTLPANVPGSTALPITVPLRYTAPDVPNSPAVVCGPTACWVGNATGLIQDPTQTPAQLVAPTTVTAISSLGGTASVSQGNAVFRIR